MVSEGTAKFKSIPFHLWSRSVSVKQCNEHLWKLVIYGVPRKSRNEILSQAREKNKKAVIIFVSFQLQIEFRRKRKGEAVISTRLSSTFTNNSFTRSRRMDGFA